MKARTRVTVNDENPSTTDAPKSTEDGVTVNITVRVRNHGDAEQLRREYEGWAHFNSRDAQDPEVAVEALQQLPLGDVTVTSAEIEAEQQPVTAVIESLDRGLTQAAAGDVVDLGDFTQYANDDIDKD